MEKCKTCKHWFIPTQYINSIDVAAPRDPITWESVTEEVKQRELFGYATQYCNSPKLVFFVRPDKDGATVVDGSEYSASMITGEDYGCTLHTPKDHNTL